MNSINRLGFLATTLLMLSSAAAEEEIFVFAQADRLEYQSEQEHWLWDLQGWIGSDVRKLWWKTEGAGDSGSADDAELQLLYSKAISPFFDLQFGLRHDFEPSPGRTFAVVGMQGLAPQWFEIDAAAFLSEDGDVSVRFESEYDLLITQRLVLQPRLEINLGIQDVPEFGLGDGLQTIDLDLRLRYEAHRKFAPYIGVSWQKSFGDTADFVRAAGEDDSLITIVAGIRLWY